jgi:hypothetical protein
MGLRFPAGANKGFSCLRHHVQARSGAHPSCYPMNTGALSPGIKRPGRETVHSPPSSAKINNAWSHTSTLPYSVMAWCLIKTLQYTAKGSLQWGGGEPTVGTYWGFNRHRCFRPSEKWNTVSCPFPFFVHWSKKGWGKGTDEKYEAVRKVRGLAAVRRCYAEGGGDCYVKLQWWG